MARAIEAISAEQYLLARLGTAGDGRRSARQLAGDLKSRLPIARWQRAIARLVDDGLLDADPRKVTLSARGRDAAKAHLGALTRDAARLTRRVEPALALGYAPNSPVAARLARPDGLRAILLTRVHQLPLDPHEVTLAQAIGSIVERALRGATTAPASLEITPPADALAGDLANIDRLRGALIRLALLAGESADTAHAVAEPTADEVGEFAARVLTLTREDHAGPFAHKTPVGHLYDVYGRRHGDAGSLESFKSRLLQASRAGLLALLPLDDATTLDSDARERSEIRVPTGALHFVERAL